MTFEEEKSALKIKLLGDYKSPLLNQKSKLFDEEVKKYTEEI